jgi:hypothetical protein
LRDLSPGDQIVMEAQSRSNTILQIYPVDGPAVEVHGDAQLTAGD